jgi:hypothetical protein
MTTRKEGRDDQTTRSNNLQAVGPRADSSSTKGWTGDSGIHRRRWILKGLGTASSIF